MERLAEVRDWESLKKLYEDILAAGDPRVKDWPMMNPLHTIALIVLYLVVVGVLVLIMRRREKGFKATGLVVAHNLFLCGLSTYMFVGITAEAIRRKYSLFSNDLDTSEEGIPMARMIWIFYMSKIPEFGDTIIMALKKNFHQISFLHVYHHTSIFFIWWIITYYAPGGESYFSAALNSWIHILMYAYYCWSALAPKPTPGPDGKLPKPRPTQPAYYKQWITRLQMTQFCVMLLQAIWDLWIEPPKNYPRFCAWILFYYMFTMLALFGNFYVQSYLKGGKRKAAKAKKDE